MRDADNPEKVVLVTCSFQANCQVVGINDHGEVFDGYDGSVDLRAFMPSDRRALADLMIARWKQFAEKP